MLFPGFAALLLGAAAVTKVRGRDGQLAVAYAALVAFAGWESLGPKAWLYTLTYQVAPGFGFLRAPARFGIVVTLGCSVLASLTLARWRRSRAWTPAASVVLFTLVLAEHVVPIPWTPPPVIGDAYRMLAQQPPGAVIELPVYSRRANFNRTRYVLASTLHWKPLVNAYSDYTPAAFSQARDTLAAFPTLPSFNLLQRSQVRYIVFHLSEYGEEHGLRPLLIANLVRFAPFLRPLYADADVWVYEITSYPESADLQANGDP